MITVLSGTNRPQSATFPVARHYFERLSALADQPVQLLSLTDIPTDILNNAMYTPRGQSDALAQIQDQYLIQADKIVYVIPEYNGSFPGVLKLFIDACSVREIKTSFKGKKAALVGVATGRAGNLRGMGHLTGILHYLGTTVFPSQLPVSRISTLKDEQGQLTDAGTLQAMEDQMQQFLEF